MTLLKRLNERLKGVRLLLLALVFAIPDILDSLVGFDWDSVLPAGYEGYGIKVSAAITLTRLILIPTIKSVKAKQAADQPAKPE